MAKERIVTMIPARRKVGNNITKEEKPKLRVAAYCRVSTDSDEQATSYEVQVEHYTEYIKNNPEWDLAGIFADDGVSGTYTKKREGFNNMIEACMDGKIDMIITKSISRFARNTLDCLKYIRQLKEKNIPVFFEKENINTMDAKGEVLLTIMASLAQQESQSLSQNVKMGYQYRYQQGKVSVNHKRFMGYTKDKDGNLVVDPNQAVVVKRIFREYLEGKGLETIGKGLEKDGILTGAGGKKWRAGTIDKMLSNEKYMGDALLQKTYTIDFLNKKRVINDGIVPQYYVENSHEAIIPRDVFMRVQEERARRSNLQGGKGKKRNFSSKYALTSIVFCPKCGDTYRRQAWMSHGRKSIVWRCATRTENGPSACDAETIHETELHACVVRAINQVIAKPDKVKEGLFSNIESILLNREQGLSIADIDKRLEELQKDIIKVAAKKGDYDYIAKEIVSLREKKQELQMDHAQMEGVKERVSEMEKFLDEHVDKVTEYDERLVRALIEKITVYDDKVDVEFKSGTKTTVIR